VHRNIHAGFAMHMPSITADATLAERSGSEFFTPLGKTVADALLGLPTLPALPFAAEGPRYVYCTKRAANIVQWEIETSSIACL